MPGQKMTKRSRRLQHIVQMKNEGVSEALTKKLHGLIRECTNGDENDELLTTVFQLWEAEKG